MSKDLKGRGFKFVGSTICYAHMQATGMVNDHLVGCWRWGELGGKNWQCAHYPLIPYFSANFGYSSATLASSQRLARGLFRMRPGARKSLSPAQAILDLRGHVLKAFVERVVPVIVHIS